jgi:hypothetical protein
VAGETRQKNAGSIEKSTSERNDSWSLAIEPEAAEKRRHTQHKNADRKGQRNLGNAPSKLPREREPKNAPGVNGAQSDLQKDASNGNTPTVCFHKLPFEIS